MTGAKCDGAVERLLRKFPGRDNPIRIKDIATMLDISPRAVWSSIERLRRAGRAIGSRRDAPGGYFWMTDRDDVEITIAFYRKQIATMERNIRILEAAVDVA